MTSLKMFLRVFFFEGEKMSLPERSFNGFKLRVLTIKDAKDYYQIGKNSKNIEYLTWYPFKSVRDAKKQLNQMYLRKANYGQLDGYAIVDVKLKKMIGIIEFHTINSFAKTAHIGYLLHQDYWNQGITSRALKELIQVGFEYFMFNKLFITTVKENIGSRKVCEKNDFKLIEIKPHFHYYEKHNTYHGLYIYTLERKDYYDSKTKGNL